MEELLYLEAPIPMAFFFCFWSQTSSLSLFSRASLLALLIGEGVESYDEATEASFCPCLLEPSWV